jgi:hypothetical protein
MTIRITILSLSLLSAFTPQAHADPAATGALNVPANRIVGLWETQATVGPCSGGTTFPVRNNLLFHAGGTITENIAPTTARNMGLGTWSYDSVTGTYTMRLRFSTYSGGVSSGYGIVERLLIPSDDGLRLSGPVRATTHSLDGIVVSQLCGEAVSERLQ